MRQDELVQRGLIALNETNLDKMDQDPHAYQIK